MNERTMRVDLLLVLMVVYCAASLFHFAHNAVFIDAYPNLPPALSPALVWAAWLGITSIGIVGYLLFRRGFHLSGLMVIAVYGALGFDGLGHYSLAPISAHTPVMNLSIWMEVLAAAALMIGVTGRFANYVRAQ